LGTWIGGARNPTGALGPLCQTSQFASLESRGKATRLPRTVWTLGSGASLVWLVFLDYLPEYDLQNPFLLPLCGTGLGCPILFRTPQFPGLIPLASLVPELWLSVVSSLGR
jgi:hypothetical protein